MGNIITRHGRSILRRLFHLDEVTSENRIVPMTNTIFPHDGNLFFRTTKVLRKLTGGTWILTTIVVITMITTDTPMAVNMATDLEDLKMDMGVEIEGPTIKVKGKAIRILIIKGPVILTEDLEIMTALTPEVTEETWARAPEILMAPATERIVDPWTILVV